MEEKYFDEIDRALEIINTPRGDFEEARNILQNIIDEVTPIIDPGVKIISVNNIIEYYMFNNRFNKSEKYTILDFPLHKLYHYIALSYVNEKDYNEAINYFKKAISISPYDINSYFELVDTYKIENEFEKMYRTLFELQKYVYTPEDLASFYIELGDYFIYKKNYDFANILYSYSTYFNENNYVEKALTKIALDLKRQLILNTKEECIQYLTRYKFPVNARKENIDLIYELYNRTKEHPEDYELRRNLKEILYSITKDEIFEDRLTIKNNQLGFTFKIPEKWKALDRTQFNKVSTGAYTLYVIEITRNVVLNLDIVKSVNQPNLIEEYKIFRDYVVKQGFNVVLESEIDATNIKYIQMITQKRLLNEYITLIHCIFIIKGQVLDFTMPTNRNYNDKNINTLYSDENVIRLNKIINSIEFF